MDSVAEYNSYGFALTNAKYRIDDEQALSLYAFKAAYYLQRLATQYNFLNHQTVPVYHDEGCMCSSELDIMRTCPMIESSCCFENLPTWCTTTLQTNQC